MCLAVLFRTAIVISFFAAEGTAQAQTVVPVVDGMKITTSNSISNVEVRAKSLGAGGCGVDFTANPGNNRAAFLAPPGTFSPWTNLASHFNSVTYTIGMNVICDTGSIAEIKYFK